MPAINQLIKKGRKKSVSKSKAPILEQNPLKRTCLQVQVKTTTLKKPNSALRKKEITGSYPGKALFRDEKFQQALALCQRMRETSQTQTVNQFQEDVQDREK